MDGLGYVILEVVKLSVVLLFRVAPVKPKDMVIYSEVSKMFIVMFTVYVMGNMISCDEQVTNTSKPIQQEIVINHERQ